MKQDPSKSYAELAGEMGVGEECIRQAVSEDLQYTTVNNCKTQGQIVTTKAQENSVSDHSTDVNRHSSSVHYVKIIYKCDLCKFTTINANTLKMHKEASHESVQYHCDYASKCSDQLKPHVISKHPEKFKKGIFRKHLKNSKRAKIRGESEHGNISRGNEAVEDSVEELQDPLSDIHNYLSIKLETEDDCVGSNLEIPTHFVKEESVSLDSIKEEEEDPLCPLTDKL